MRFFRRKRKRTVMPGELTRKNACEAIEAALDPLLAARAHFDRGESVSTRLDWCGEPVDTKEFLAKFNAPKTFQGSSGEIHFSFPQAFKPILAIPPTHSRDCFLREGDVDVAVYPFVLGLGRSVFPEESEYPTRDPSSGDVKRHWNDHLKKMYALSFEGDDMTCWGIYDLMLFKDHPPVVRQYELQNTVLFMDENVRDELRGLKDGLSGRDRNKWGNHYSRILRKTENRQFTQAVPAFAYQHRASLLPLTVADAMGRMGVKHFSTRGSIPNDRSVYTQSYNFLKNCETGLEIMSFDDLECMIRK